MKATSCNTKQCGKHSSLWFLFLLLAGIHLFPAALIAQESEGIPVATIRFDQLPPDQPYLPLMRGWLFQSGDDPSWASPSLADSLWEQRMPFMVAPEEEWDGGTAWWRLHFQVDSSLSNQHLSMIYMIYGAVEIYLNGELLVREGEFGEDGSYKAGRIVYFPAPLDMPNLMSGEQVLALRVNRGPNPTWMNLQDLPTGAGFVLGIGPSGRLTKGYAEMFKLSRPYLFLTGLLAATGALALILFFMMPKFRAGLYYGLFGIITSLYTIFWLNLETDLPVSILPYWHLLSEGFFIVSLSLIIRFLQESFRARNLRLVGIPLSLSVIGLVLSLVMRQDLSLYYYIPFLLVIGWVLIRAVVQKKDDAWIATIGFGFLMLGLLYDVLLDTGLIGELVDYNLAFGLTYPWPSIAMIVLLARQFARLNREIDEKNREALAIRAELEHARLETVQQLSKAVAHEFNSPLAIIQGFTELIRQSDIPEEKRQEYISRLPVQIERMKELVRKLMRLRTLDEVDYAAGIKMLDLHGPYKVSKSHDKKNHNN